MTDKTLLNNRQGNNLFAPEYSFLELLYPLALARVVCFFWPVLCAFHLGHDLAFSWELDTVLMGR